jgi:hypothetical protein
MSVALRPALALAFVSFGAFSAIQAQEVSLPSKTDMARCVNWMNAKVPATFDPADFCAGVKRGDTAGWWAVFKCGRMGQEITGTPARYCTSSGNITDREAWGAGVRSATRDGHELLEGTSEAGKDSYQVAQGLET